MAGLRRREIAAQAAGAGAGEGAAKSEIISGSRSRRGSRGSEKRNASRSIVEEISTLGEKHEKYL